MKALFPEKLKNGIEEFKRNSNGNKVSYFIKLIKDNQISLTVLTILSLAFFFRLWQINALPLGVSESENIIYKKIATLSDGGFNFALDIYDAVYIFLGYVLTKIFGLSVLNLRIFSAIIGSVTVVLSYIFISKWFSKKIAIFMALLFAISSFHVTVSRLILPEILLPLILLALFVSLTYAFRNKNIWLFGLSGALLGVGLYTSQAFVVIFLLFIISGLYFVSRNKKFLTSYRSELLVSVFGFISMSIPYFFIIIKDWPTISKEWVFVDSFQQFAINFSEVPRILFVGFSSDFFINVGTEPLLDPLIFISSVFGFLFAIFAIIRRKYFFLISWLLLFYVYASLRDSVFALDLLGLLPAIYTLAALIVDYVIDHWFKTFPHNKNAKIIAVGLISIFFALSMLYNFNRYFVAYKNSEQVKEVFKVTEE